MPGRSGLAPKITLGIDLGTTFTVAARHGEVVEIADHERMPTLLPSVLAFPVGGAPLVGWSALDHQAVDPRNTLASTKRLMGAPYGSQRARRFEHAHPYEIVDADGKAALRTRAGDLEPTDVATWILGEAARGAGVQPGATSVVLTVPASFGANARRATLEAADRAGFAAAHLIDEPIATAVAYLARSSLRYAVVYDIGGGTFDLALVDCSAYPFTVVAHSGDPYLGGLDVDRELAMHVADQVMRARRWDLSRDRDTFARLVAWCERAKTLLTDHETVGVDLVAVDPAGPWGLEGEVFALTRGHLAGITERLVGRTLAHCDVMLEQAEVKRAQVDAVFVTGGASALPGLSARVSDYFGKRVRRDIDPLHAVAIGASLAAARPDLSALLDVHAA